MSRRRLFTFIGRRLAALVLVLLAMSFLIFALLHLAPGNAVELLLGPREATPAAVAAIRHEYHLDQPFIVQYLDWLRGALHFNFGTSIVSGQPVGQEIIGQLGLPAPARRARVRLRVRGRDPTWSPCRSATAYLGRPGDGRVQRRRYQRAGIRNGDPPAVHLRDQARLVPRFRRGKRLFSQHRHLALPAIALGLTGMGLLLRLTRAGASAAIERTTSRSRARVGSREVGSSGHTCCATRSYRSSPRAV